MTLSIRSFLADNPVDREKIDEAKQKMLAEVRANKLRELREAAGLSQQQVANRIGVSQRQVSKIEHGDLENAKIRTIRGYLEAVGGALSVEYVTGDLKLQVA
jgi:transcriptional regulator with XRE-family HTH domain